MRLERWAGLPPQELLCNVLNPLQEEKNITGGFDFKPQTRSIVLHIRKGPGHFMPLHPWKRFSLRHVMTVLFSGPDVSVFRNGPGRQEFE